MSLYRYFQRNPSLPTSQQTGIGNRATHEANKAVPEALASAKEGSRKRKKYTKFSGEDRASIGKYASENRNSNAIKKFKSTHPDLVESTVRLFKKRYLDTVKQNMKQGDTAVISIPSKRRGRPLMLGDFDPKIQEYIRALRQAGTPVGSAVIIAAAKGIVMSNDRTALVEYGGHIELTKSWAQSLMLRMGACETKGYN